MVATVRCPKCNYANNVVRIHPRTVEEIMPEFEGGERVKDKIADPSDRGAFYCPDCNYDFTAVGVTWHESKGWLKVK